MRKVIVVLGLSLGAIGLTAGVAGAQHSDPKWSGPHQVCHTNKHGVTKCHTAK